jgi:YjbE family integral membrane protein
VASLIYFDQSANLKYMTWDFIASFLQIVVIDLTLSGDNAIVIGMAAASLPQNQRTKAIVIGGACAIGLRIALTIIAAWLIRIPLLSAIAGVVLFWIAWKLLRMDVEPQEVSERKSHKQAGSFKQAIIIILTADFMMSLDNVLSVAGAAQNSYLLLILGLLFSMPLLMTTGGFISRLIDKFKWIPFLGAAVISYVGMEMILKDKFIIRYYDFSELWTIIISLAFGLALPTIIFLNEKRKVDRI